MGSTQKEVPDRMRRVFQDTPYWLEASLTPGMSVALLAGGKTRGVLCLGTTDIEGATLVSETTIYPAASLSKQAFLYAVLRAVEAGKLDLDRPLAQYVDSPHSLYDAEIGAITARHVLTHTTGWRNWPPKDQPVERIGSPGEKWGYSGQGFIYLQEALGSILRESPENYTRRLVLDPLGMHHSSFVWLEEYEQTAVQGHEPHNVLDHWRAEDVNAAASLQTSAREYALLLEMFLSPQLRQRHPDVYLQQVRINSRVGWSLGWGTADDTLWQWGHNDGIKSFAALRPSLGLGIVCLSNGARAQRINREWVNAWLETDLPAFYFSEIEL